MPLNVILDTLMAKTSYLDKKNRHDRLIGLLKSDDFWTAKKLSKFLDISLRTLMRDLKEIQEMGIPIDSERGRGGGVRINQNYGLSKLDLNHKEIIDLLLALSTIEKLNSPIFLQNIKSIKDKIMRAFPPSQKSQVQSLRKRLYIGETASQSVLDSYTTPKLDITDLIHESFFCQSQIEITYTAESKAPLARIIEPHYLVLNWPVWYIIAWDELRNDIRAFRLDRVSKVNKLNTSFKLHHVSRFKEQLGKFSSII